MIILNAYTKKISGKTVLNNVNYTIKSGKCLGLYGKNASGKTMLLRAISGLILPTSGSVSVDGEILTPKVRFSQSMGVLIEHLDFWQFMTSKETLEYLNSFQKKATKKDIEEALTRVGLNPNDTRKVYKFSLGMKQKLSIAQAIFEKPTLLLFDEPTNSLDNESRLLFQNIISEEKKKGTTIVIASHIKEDLLMCDEIVEIENGEIVSTKLD